MLVICRLLSCFTHVERLIWPTWYRLIFPEFDTVDQQNEVNDLPHFPKKRREKSWVCFFYFRLTQCKDNELLYYFFLNSVLWALFLTCSLPSSEIKWAEWEIKYQGDKFINLTMLICLKLQHSTWRSRIYSRPGERLLTLTQRRSAEAVWSSLIIFCPLQRHSTGRSLN